MRRNQRFHGSTSMSSSSFGSTVFSRFVSSTSDSVMTWKGFGRLGSSSRESCACAWTIVFLCSGHCRSLWKTKTWSEPCFSWMLSSQNKPLSAQFVSHCCPSNQGVILLSRAFSWFWILVNITIIIFVCLFVCFCFVLFCFVCLFVCFFGGPLLY